jgi:hypothetical protein
MQFSNSFSEMTQQGLVLQLHEEGISAVAMHTRLVDVLVPLHLHIRL